MSPARFNAEQHARRLYAAGDRAPYRSDERAVLYRLAARAQRQAEAVAELERHTQKRRKAA
jgi:NADH dehydrogenase FAD-containing subunit